MSREAMSLALEALEEAWYHVGTFQPTEKAIDLYDKARAALREALAEQPAQQALDKKAENARELGLDYEPAQYSDIVSDGGLDPRNKFDQPAQQEPEFFEQWNSKQHGDPEEIGFLQALRIAYCAGQDSITSPPAQRTWVGLTNNELQPIADEYRILFGSWVEDFARAIEAKLKEKNT